VGEADLAARGQGAVGLAWLMGRHREAAAAYQRAAAMTPTDAEQDFLRRGGRASREADR
jgi:predicted RNA polymerase sigma factor